jgi:hypothetical protein
MLASQMSVVHALPSSQPGRPPTHAPATQVSAPLQGSPSSHDAATGECTQPLVESHASAVQTLRSSQSRSVATMQIPCWQRPPLHASPVLHGPAFGACAQPLAGSHESSVHTLLSSQSRGVPAVQAPSAQISVPSQASPSAHEAVFALCTQEPPSSAASSVQGL